MFESIAGKMIAMVILVNKSWMVGGMCECGGEGAGEDGPNFRLFGLRLVLKYQHVHVHL